MTASSASRRVGWCPGALRPMMTGDGLLVRVKPRCGALAPSVALAIADLSLRYGNGMLDLTTRANLQIRGVRADDLDRLVAGLDALGLIDAHAEVEAVRNILVTPLAGLDPAIPFNATAAATALEQMLVSDPACWRLPAKWSFGVDDGGAVSLRDTPSDISFEALQDGRIAVALADATAYGVCSPGTITEAAAALCRIAIRADASRMATLVRQHGATAILAEAGLPSLSERSARAAYRPEDLIGVQAVGQFGVLGLAPPFGRLPAEQWAALLTAAQQRGVTEIRLAPGRSILVVLPSSAEATALLTALRVGDWITTRADPRFHVAACPGQPACARGSTPVLADAAAAALRLNGLSDRSGEVLHVSGCAKGCAHPGPAAATLVGRDGRYDLVLGGKPGDKPSHVGLSLQPALRIIEAAWR